MKLALSTLCENPDRRTGLSTLFPALVAESLRLFPGMQWIVFAGPRQSWDVIDTRVEIVREFPANDRLYGRLWADHFRVGPTAAACGADALITTGFMPLRAPLPVAMQVVTLHHLRRDFGGGGVRGFYRRCTLARGLRRASLVIANSHYAAGLIAAECPGVEKRLLVSPEGLDHGRFHPSAASGEAEALRRELGLTPGYALWTANFYPYKQAELLLETYARLPEALRAAHPLVLVGGDWQGELGRAQIAAQQLRLSEQTKFLGWVDDRWLPALYRHAAAHVLPSAEETFGRSVTEAMACGCPCVLNDIPALREVADGAAVLIDFRDAASAAAALSSRSQASESACCKAMQTPRSMKLARAAKLVAATIQPNVSNPRWPTSNGSCANPQNAVIIRAPNEAKIVSRTARERPAA